MYKMTDSDNQFLMRLLLELGREVNTKFIVLTKAEDGHLYDLSEEELEIEETKAMINLVILRLTKLIKRQDDKKNSPRS